jgi:glutamyl-Q tRNA(Asp) synthetase
LVVTRFAPSPTGYLHLGHAYSAWLNHRQARAADGRFVLRIEDLNRARCRPEYAQTALDDLRWLGLHWDEPLVRQSEQREVHAARLADLEKRGLVYRCTAPEDTIGTAVDAPHGPGPSFESPSLAAMDARDRDAARRGPVWRLSLDAASRSLGDEFDALSVTEQTPDGLVERSATPTRFGDAIVAVEDRGATYHLASVIDDAGQGVTHVTRGDELSEAAGFHVLLATLMGMRPPVYRHHPMIVDDHGQRLSKRGNATPLKTMREQGMTPEEVLRQFRDDL